MTSAVLRRQRRATFTVFLANGCGIGGWAAAIPELKRDLALGDGQLSLVLLAVALGALLTMPFAGVLVPRLGGTGRLTRLSILAFVLVLIWPGVAPSLGWLLPCALLLGASNGLIDVAMNAHASDVESRWNGPLMSSFHAAFSLGGFLGAGLGALVLHLGASALVVLLAAALVALVLALPAALALDEGDRSPVSHALRLPDRRVLALGLIAMGCLMLEGAMTDWSAVYLGQVGGASPVVATLGYAAFSLTMLVGRLFGDGIRARFGGPQVIVGGALLATLGLALAVLLPAPWTAILGFALVGLGLSNVVPAAFSAAGQVAETPAAGIAMTATAGYLGFLLGPPLIGAVAGQVGLRGSLLLLTLIGVAVALLALRQRKA
ncbi:MFS transporter [Pseudomonas benzopyrenica]|uniref:MFS transporter n=1 Tax=Pseudomonas benzopyrenica TaxID=2993566 RepID=A0ABZ2FTF1_9PSED